MDPYSSFVQGVQAAFTTPGNFVAFLITILALSVFFMVLFYIYRAYHNYIYEKRILEPRNSNFKIPPGHISEFNPAQKKIINNIISDFKNVEMIASEIPSSVLERFSEYFYLRIDELRISNRTAQILTKKIYPIIDNSKLEIEIYEKNRLYVLERQALEANSKTVIINNISGIPLPVKKGVPVNICYTSNNMFICGESSVVNLLNGGRTQLSYPKNLKISQERLYSRIPVDDIAGLLFAINTGDASQIEVIVKDISLEGARIRSSIALKRKETYRLSFTDMSFEKMYNFEKIECIISKSFMIEDNVFDYGLSFIYLDLQTRKDLYEYFQALAQRTQKDVDHV
ncbi:MAG: PilZ domain-containing protein [Brevinematales bacterium]